MPSYICCLLCGFTIYNDEDPEGVSWTNQFRAILSIDGGRPALSGVGIFDDPGNGVFFAPPDPTARWDDDLEHYDRENSADAFGTGDYALGGRCGFPFHVSCWALLEKVFHPANVPCARLYGVCQSLPRSDIFFSWGHDYGGLVASDTVNHLPWGVQERFLDPHQYGSDDENKTPEHERASAVSSHQDHMSRLTRRSSQVGGDIEEQNSENTMDSNEHTDELSDDVSDTSELGVSEESTNPSMRDIYGHPESRVVEEDSLEESVLSTTLEASESIEDDQSWDGGEDPVAEYDSSVIQESRFATDYFNETQQSGRNFVRNSLSTAGVIPQSSPSDSDSEYMPSEDSDHVPRLHPAVPTSDPYNIPEVQMLLMESPQVPPFSPVQNSLFTGDVFVKLPEEIRTVIANYLVTSDALSLRTASRSFWHIFYSQQFWKSRFVLHHSDRSWLFEALDGNVIRDWRYLYRRTSNLYSSPALQNRRRIWPLAIRILDILCLEDLQYHEDHETSHSFDILDTDDQKIIGVAGLINSQPTPSHIRQGCRIMHRQRLTLSEPEKLSYIAFSEVRVGNTTYISGMRFVSAKTSQQIGYRSPREHSLTFKSRLKGWRIAVGARGIHGIQCVIADGEAQLPWFGSVEDACITDRLANCDIRTVDFGLDGCKVVSMAVIQSATSDLSLRPPSLRNAALWFRDIPELSFCLNEQSYLQPEDDTSGYSPLLWTKFGGPKGMYLRHLTGMEVHANGHITGVRFQYDTNDIPSDFRELGRHSCWKYGCERPMNFPIDGPSGERITSIEICCEIISSESDDQLGASAEITLESFKTFTNYGRSSNFYVERPRAFRYPNAREVIKKIDVEPGTTITGFYAALTRGPGPFWKTIGLISEVIEAE